MRKRSIFFELNDISFNYDFGTHALLIYYANQINSELTRKMLNVTKSDFFYRAEYDLPRDNLTSSDKEVYFNIPDIQSVIKFIDEILIPSLAQEPIDLIEKYGGQDGFYVLFNENNELPVEIYEEEWYVGLPSYIISYLNQFKELAQYAISINQPYKVYVW